MIKFINNKINQIKEASLNRRNNNILKQTKVTIGNTNKKLNELFNEKFSLNGIEFKLKKNISKLAWCAKIYEDKMTITHGEGVHKHDKGIIEGVWDGNFSELNYAESKYVFGSGITIFNDKIIFTPPSHMYECIFCLYVKNKKHIYFSNSLSFIFSYLEFDDEFIDIAELSRKNNDNLTSKGVFNYDPILFKNEEIVLLGFYYHNIIFHSGTVNLEFREDINKFSDFTEYKEFLLSKINSLITNGKNDLRTIKFPPISTISKGYDSPAVSILVNEKFPLETVTMDVDVYGSNDSGEKIAECLNIKCHVCKHPIGDSIDDLNLDYSEELGIKIKEFIATIGLGDDLIFLAFDKYLSNRILFTGALGDTIWDKNNTPPYGIPVRVPFGKSMNEYRLQKGFFHVPLPTIGSVFPNYIYEINFSKEMSKYSTKDNYDRPIPRRIIEESEIPRGMFAITKNATNPNPLNLTKFKKDSFSSLISKYRLNT